MVYLDNASTTKVADEVVEAMLPYFSDKYGNSSSNHKLGREAKDALEDAREKIANTINASPEEIIFTSGGTESNNLAIKEILCANTSKGNHAVTSQIEHDSVLNVCRFLEKYGSKINYLGVDNEGYVDIEKLKNTITKQTTLVSIMHANNEIGTIQNIKEICKICKENGVLFHTDACQSFTKESLDADNADLITLNSHKIHGPKGVGALYVKQGTKIHPLLHGGGHEFGLRSGTVNVAGIVGFAKAVELAFNDDYVSKIKKLKNQLVDDVLNLEGVRLNSPKDGICNIANFSFKGLQGDSIVAYLDENNICASVGSACTTDKLEPSHVLRAIGLNKVDALSAVRFSLSRYNTKEEIGKVLEVLPKIMGKLRRVSVLKR